MRSIQRHLLVWILGALSLGSLGLVGVAYFVNRDELTEIVDENLQQVALSVASHYETSQAAAPSGTQQALPVPELDMVVCIWTPDGRLTFASHPKVQLPFDAPEGVSITRIGNEEYRVYTAKRPGAVVQAAQPMSLRAQIAAEAASKMFVPLLLLMLLIGVLLVVALRQGLRPLDAAAKDLAARSSASLAPLGRDDAPREIHPLVQAIDDLMQRLSLAFANQRRFVADAAHELRTPVTALKLQLQLLERAVDAAQRQEAIAELKTGIERAQHLIEQLLQLSRAEPDAPLPPFAPVALAEIVNDVVTHLSITAEHQGVDLGAQVSASRVVQGDRHQLTVLLKNLVENALRHSPQGGMVDVMAADIDGAATLRVVDNGPGIPESERARVFDRFYRGEPTAASPGQRGSGLGLAIVRAIAERHGASVQLVTAPSGLGLEARVVFPRTGP